MMNNNNNNNNNKKNTHCNTQSPKEMCLGRVLPSHALRLCVGGCVYIRAGRVASVHSLVFRALTNPDLVIYPVITSYFLSSPYICTFHHIRPLSRSHIKLCCTTLLYVLRDRNMPSILFGVDQPMFSHGSDRIQPFPFRSKNMILWNPSRRLRQKRRWFN